MKAKEVKTCIEANCGIVIAGRNIRCDDHKLAHYRKANLEKWHRNNSKRAGANAPSPFPEPKKKRISKITEKEQRLINTICADMEKVPLQNNLSLHPSIAWLFGK